MPTAQRASRRPRPPRPGPRAQAGRSPLVVALTSACVEQYEKPRTELTSPVPLKKEADGPKRVISVLLDKGADVNRADEAGPARA